MVEVKDVFANSLPKLVDAIKQGEYMRGGAITTNLGQISVQLEHKREVFVCGVLDNTCFQLHQAAETYNIPRSFLDEVNVEVAAQITALITAYNNKKSVCEIL
ncbi:MAG: hypothetical protein F4202_00545 [Cenarchaeum sp. SB0677_bin_16]|nr:hypothetical protein [Cenarchaeum sp. SB0677_bin_16]